MKEVLIGNIEQRYEETNGLEVYIWSQVASVKSI